MTVPNERTRAVIQTQQFLVDLCIPSKTPRVPKAVRQQAHHLLRHYPSPYDMQVIADREDGSDVRLHKVFGNDYK